MIRQPLVVILGATGTGKSKLAIQICKRFGGEVISADSMQVYKGLDVITNKVTEEEADGIKHHMIDIIEPPARFSVVDFRNKALPLIKDFHSRGILPVVVGGTNYYIESLIWKILVEDEKPQELSLGQDDEESDLLMNKYPYEDIEKVVATLLRTRYLMEFIEFSERVFLAYLQFRIDSMPRFHDVIGDLLDSPANFSDSLLIHKATDVLDEIADYELGSVVVCTRYRWIMRSLRDVEKILLEFVVNVHNRIKEVIDKNKRNEMETSGNEGKSGTEELEEELIGAFRNLHKGPCLENIEFSVSDHPIPAEYALLSLRMDELKVNNCFTEIRHAMELLNLYIPSLDYRTLREISIEVYTYAQVAFDLLLPKLVKIVSAECLLTGPVPNALPSEQDPETLYKLLSDLDPKMAATLHPNDSRKVLRSIQVCLQKGKRHSDIIAEQKMSGGGSSLGGPLRFEKTAIFWLQCQPDVLDKRLDERVDEMMSKGLVKELMDFLHKYNQVCKPAITSENSQENLKERSIYTQGIFQSIGFKEFDCYFKLSPEERSDSSQAGRKALEEGLTGLRLATKRYAKRQNKWVTQRFINTPDRYVPPVYALDISDPSQWDTQVLSPATAVVQTLLGQTEEGCSVPSPVPRPSQITPPAQMNNKSHNYCETCERVFIGDFQWNAHMKSKKHQKAARKKKQMPSCKKEKLDKATPSDRPSTSLSM